MEDFNSDDPLEIDMRRDENDEENDFKATKEDDEKGSMTKFTATYCFLLPRGCYQGRQGHNQEAIKEV